MQPRQGRACFPLTFVIWGNFSESQDLDALLANVLTRSLGPGLAYDLLTSLPLPPLCCTTVPPCYCILHLLAVFPFALLSIEPCVAPWACRKPDTARVFPLGGTFFGFSHIPPTFAGRGRKAERSGRSYTHCASSLPNLARPYSVTRSTLILYLC